MDVEFILGEIKYVDFTVTSKNNKPFVIASANYRLLNNDGEAILEGACDIEGHTLSVLLSPQERGRFILEVSYAIPPEQRKARVYVHVT